jgi:hypothetical protein
MDLHILNSLPPGCKQAVSSIFQRQMAQSKLLLSLVPCPIVLAWHISPLQPPLTGRLVVAGHFGSVTLFHCLKLSFLNRWN